MTVKPLFASHHSGLIRHVVLYWKTLFSYLKYVVLRQGYDPHIGHFSPYIYLYITLVYMLMCVFVFGGSVLPWQEILHIVLDKGARYTELEYVNLLNLLARSRPGTDMENVTLVLQRLTDYMKRNPIPEYCKFLFRLSFTACKCLVFAPSHLVVDRFCSALFVCHFILKAALFDHHVSRN